MKSLSFILLSSFLATLPKGLAGTTATVTLVEKPSSTFTLVDHRVATASSPDPTTFATSAKTTSVLQATKHETHQYAAVASASGGYSGYGSNAVNTEGGAAGTSSGSFNLSKGALIAIIVVVVTVAVFGSKSKVRGLREGVCS